MPSMHDKVVVVTGAMRGIGFGIAQEMVDAGATVVITDLDRAGLDDAVSELGPRASGLVADVTDPIAMERTIAEVVSTHGRLDAVVANAGVGASAPLGSITEQQFDFIFGVNVKGVLFTVQAAIPHLSPGGTVVIIGSTASIRSEYGMSLYGGAKAALRQMVRTWIRELPGSGIRVNVVSPGAIDTPSLRSALAGSVGDAQVDARVAEMGAGNPIGRLGTVRDIGKSVVFLASDDSSFVTGIELFADGGMAQTG
jgi:NAD(P)-dependent dehydrogenase (short-subunit alcohol dehydrogenase family)